MKPSRVFFAFISKLIVVLVLSIGLTHCASINRGEPPAHEGGIVGSGNQTDCHNKSDKSRCNENIR